MTESNAKAPEGMHTITPHIVVNDAAKAAAWYKEVLDAEERSRIELPRGKLMQVELWFGDSAVMLADEFPELGVLSPLSVGGTSTVLHLYTKDVDALCAPDLVDARCGMYFLCPPLSRYLSKVRKANR